MASNIAFLAHLLINAGCSNTDLTYREACIKGYDRATQNTYWANQVEQDRQSLQDLGNKLANEYIFPVLNKDLSAVIIISADALSRREIKYAINYESGSLIIVLKPDQISSSLSWSIP